MLLLSLCPLFFHLVFDHTFYCISTQFFRSISESFNVPLYTPPAASSLPIALLFNVLNDYLFGFLNLVKTNGYNFQGGQIAELGICDKMLTEDKFITTVIVSVSS